MRQIDSGVPTATVEDRLAYRLGRRLGEALHAPRAWLNAQVQLARLGVRAGDSNAFLQAYRTQYPHARGLHADASQPSISDGKAVS